MERMNKNDYDECTFELMLDAYADLETDDFIEFATDWRIKMDRLIKQACFDRDSYNESMYQKRHEEEVVREYKAQLI